MKVTTTSVPPKSAPPKACASARVAASAPGTSRQQESTRVEKVRFRYESDDSAFIELDHRMLRKEFVKRLQNVNGVQMVSVFMMFKKPKI